MQILRKSPSDFSRDDFGKIVSGTNCACDFCGRKAAREIADSVLEIIKKQL